MLKLDRLIVQTDPYPVGVCLPALPTVVYEELAAVFPPATLFAEVGGRVNTKYSLSQVNHEAQYFAYLEQVRAWKIFYLYVKGPKFIPQTLGTLREAGFPIVIDRSPGVKYKARFEFSLLPAKGGRLAPHTDLPSKIVTLVIGMPPADQVWNDQWGGGTDILKPKPGQKALKDYEAPMTAFTKVTSYPYRANQCVAFVKSATSWHSVGPMTGTGAQMRRTITINIERFTRTF